MPATGRTGKDARMGVNKRSGQNFQIDGAVNGFRV
jgi:hypothetical protein